MEEEPWGRALLRKVAPLVGPRTRSGIAAGPHVGVHLAIFVEPYLRLVLEGRKTIESRFGVQRCAPHGRVASGDVLLLKEAGGPVIGACRVGETWFFDLREVPIDSVRERFAGPLCAEDPSFWAQRAHATLATLMGIERVTRLEPMTVEKRDRRGWVTLRQASSLFAAASA
jgi:ASC-1-like (ASCH) protein